MKMCFMHRGLSIFLFVKTSLFGAIALLVGLFYCIQEGALQVAELPGILRKGKDSNKQYG